jgi:hypothetical protein
MPAMSGVARRTARVAGLTLWLAAMGVVVATAVGMTMLVVIALVQREPPTLREIADALPLVVILGGPVGALAGPLLRLVFRRVPLLPLIGAALVGAVIGAVATVYASMPVGLGEIALLLAIPGAALGSYVACSLLARRAARRSSTR